MAFLNSFTFILSICFAFHLACANVFVSAGNASVQDGLQPYNWKPRVFILSDILNEPDDSMSLVRYLLYSSEFDTRGLCATTSWWLKNATHPEEMRIIIQAYGKVVDNLNQHVHPTARYQSAEDLLQLVTSGPTVSIPAHTLHLLRNTLDILVFFFFFFSDQRVDM